MANETTNYNISRPTLGGDQDQWGSILNTSIQTIDTTIKNVSDAIPTTVFQSSITDTPNSLGTSKQVLRINAAGNNTEFATPAIVDLSDTPASMGTAGQILKVNSGGTALEFSADTGATLANFSVSSGVSSDAVGSLSYESSTGVFTYNRPNLSTYLSTNNFLLLTRTAYVNGYASNTAFNEVGTYIWASATTGNTATEFSNGDDVSGSSIYPASAIAIEASSKMDLTPDTTAVGTGTWKCMGAMTNGASMNTTNNYKAYRTTLWLRVA